MKQFIIIFLLIFLKTGSLSHSIFQNYWIAWNIGQGQWVTHVLTDQCMHFDIGGEFGSFKQIKSKLLRQCGNKENQIYLSHWDYDHYFNFLSAAKTLAHLCWQIQPHFESEKKSAQKILKIPVPSCLKQQNQKNVFTSFIFSWFAKNPKTTNDSSIVNLSDSVLIPGDSTIKEEFFWSQQIPHIEQTKVLILGHHGSRTSTGLTLLQSLPHLLFAISSARFAKYKHPHVETLARLQLKKIPTLKTEDWGNIWFTF